MYMCYVYVSIIITFNNAEWYDYVNEMGILRGCRFVLKFFRMGGKNNFFVDILGQNPHNRNFAEPQTQTGLL